LSPDKLGNGAGSSTHQKYNSEATMNETLGTRMITARTHLKQQEELSRAIALHKFQRRNEHRQQTKIAGSMIVLFALVIANAWAVVNGWGL
jgi:hypothetical protein